MTKFVQYFLLPILLYFLIDCNSPEHQIDNIYNQFQSVKDKPLNQPKIFAPGFVSNKYWEHSGIVFSPDGKEMFWSVALNEGRTPRIIVILNSRLINGNWTKPELAPFNNSNYNHINSISPDGKRLYFYSGNGGAFIVTNNN